MHYTVLVIGDDIKKQLAPFDESLEIPRTISTEELIAKSRKEVEDYKNGRYAEYLANSKKYLEEAKGNPGHCRYIVEELPLKLKWTDKQHLESVHEWYEPEDINEDGSVNTTYNPDSQWDWYQLGGRWIGRLVLKDNATSGIRGEKSLLFGLEEPRPNGYDSALIKDVDWEHEDMKDFYTYAVLRDGKWYKSEEMGWDKKFQELIKELDPENRISVVDIHI